MIGYSSQFRGRDTEKQKRPVNHGEIMPVQYGTALRKWANRNKILKILAVVYIIEWRDLNSQRVGKGKNVKGGMGLKMCEFETLT